MFTFSVITDKAEFTFAILLFILYIPFISLLLPSFVLDTHFLIYNFNSLVFYNVFCYFLSVRIQVLF